MHPPPPRRPWWCRLRLSIRTLTLIVLIVGGGLGWFVRRAAVQRDAVKAITKVGGTVRYDFQKDAWPRKPVGPALAPRWLVDLIGIDYFANVTSVRFQKPQAEAILAHVGRLRRLERLDATSMSVTDAGLARLAGLSELRSLSCSGTLGLTDAGLAHLAGLGKLESLAIYDTLAIDGPGLAHLAGLHQLRYLAIDIRIESGLMGLSRLVGLRHLSLSVPIPTDEVFAQLSRLTSLEELEFGSLDRTGSDAGVTRLKSLTNLKILQVYGPWFTDNGLAPISEMDHLSNFFVADITNVTPDGLARLQRQRPTLRIGVNGSGRVSPAWVARLRAAVKPL